MISPVHEDWITKITIFNEILITASLDLKIKLWIYDINKNEYILQHSYLHTNKINCMQNIDKILIVGDSNGGLSILEIN